MLQRALAHYRSLNTVNRETVDTHLRDLGGLEQMQIEIEQPLNRTEFKLVADGTFRP
jgi:hypothetical protein